MFKRTSLALACLTAALAAEASPRAPAGKPALRLPPPCLACGLPVVPVNIVGRRADGSFDDRRGPLADLAPGLGLSPGEAARIRASTGFVLCDVDGMKPIASGVLIGDGRAIATAAHVLRDPKRGGTPFPPAMRCAFRTQSVPPETVPLRLDASKVLGAGGRDPSDPNDYAVVRLSTPLANPLARPFPGVPPPTATGSRVLLVSAFQADLSPRSGTPDPIVQEATIEVAGTTEPGAPRPLYLSGAMDMGGSGGPMLVRQDGELALAGIVSSTGAINRNGMPFSIAMHSFVRVISVEGSFRTAVEGAAHPQAVP